MTAIWNDVRYAARRLARAPGFLIVETFTLALAIGAITAVLSVVNGVLLAPLPLGAPDRVMAAANAGRDGKGAASSALDYLDFRHQLTSFSFLAGYDKAAANLGSRRRRGARRPIPRPIDAQLSHARAQRVRVDAERRRGAERAFDSA